MRSILSSIHLTSLALALVSIAPAVLAKAPAADQPISAEEERRLQEKYASYRNTDPDYRHAGEETVENWMDWKWGLRIHWGLYTMFNGQESWIITEHLKDKEWQKNYYTSYQDFNPTNFDAEEWMKIMDAAGMKFFSITTKHHEGFCLWPTKTLQKGLFKKPDGTYEDVTNHFSIEETPYKKDIIADLMKAGRAHGLGISFYYSHIDWHDWDFAWDKRNFWYDPNFTKESDPKRWAAFIQKERDQLTELLTSYGTVDMVSLDINWPDAAQEDAYSLARMARKLQPHVLLRNRGIKDYGDYETPEATIPANPNKINRPWKVIYPCGKGFSYHEHDTYKPKEWVLSSLVDVVAKGGNFEVGFGPDRTGKWPQEMIDRVTYVGDWLKINGECIYATRPYYRYQETNGVNLRFTRSKDKKTVYVISLKWPGDSLLTTLVKAKEGSKIHLLGYDSDLKWTQDEKGLTIQMPTELQDETKRPSRQAYAFKIESQDWNTAELDIH